MNRLKDKYIRKNEWIKRTGILGWMDERTEMLNEWMDESKVILEWMNEWKDRNVGMKGSIKGHKYWNERMLRWMNGLKDMNVVSMNERMKGQECC